MRHRRHTLAHLPASSLGLTGRRLRRLCATVSVPCVTAVLAATLAAAAPAPEVRAPNPAGAAAVREYAGGPVKSPARQGTSHAAHARPAPSSSATGSGRRDHGPGAGARTGIGSGAGGGAGAHGGAGAPGTQDLHGPGTGALADDPASAPDRPPTTAATGEVSPVLPLGAGMTLIGLGLALIAVRLRRG